MTKPFEIPDDVVTTIGTSAPLPAGAVTTIEFAVLLVIGATVPPTVTEVALHRLEPVNVKAAPPAQESDDGEYEANSGAI
jgi:uncharacterized protein with FMN-binding domain